MMQSWENLVTDEQTNRQMDKIDFIGRRPTNFERPRGGISYTIIYSSS